MELMTGYDLAKRILDHPQGGVEALLRFSGKDESFWLELKAGVCPRPEDAAKGETPSDLYWNIASAVLELINTSGGVVLIGVQNTTHAPVPLNENDPRHIIEKEGLEAYRRKEIWERIWRDDKKWATKKYGAWEIQDPVPFSLVEVVGCRCRNEDIAAILVKPVEGPCIRIWKNGDIEEIRARVPGEIGKVLEVKGSRQMDAYDKDREKERQIRSEHFEMLYEKFLAEAEAASADGEILRKIEEYYAKFEKDLAERRRFDLSCFTPLDASGGMTEEEQPEEFMSPEAVELIESEDWLDDDWEEPEDGDEDLRDDEDEDEDGDEEERSPGYQVSRSGDLLTLMNEIPRISILGEPGGGKTTTLLRFASQFCREKSDFPVLAVFIPMGQWREGGSIALLLSRITGLTPAQWGLLIREKKLRLIIDAVNECPEQFRQAAVLDIGNFLRANPEVPAAISARTDEDLKALRLPTFTVQPMDKEHQRLYLTKYLKDENRADEIMRRLAAMSGGTEIAANPMLLRLIVEVVRKDDELPAGRAALYRKWLRQWYARESGKLRSAGETLPWSEGETLKIFSELAFQSRLKGYRDVPVETAAEILQAYGPECVEKLCQGPVVTIDKDYIRFRHETFQEYLCAEYLLKNPSALPEVTDRDYAQWGMPIAYASELLQSLPDPLLLSAWRMNPWFGFALTDNERYFNISSSATGHLPEKWQRLFEYVSSEDWSSDVNVSSLEGWYLPGDRNLVYLIATNPKIMSLWRRMELWRLSLSNPHSRSPILCHSLTLKPGMEVSSWKDTWDHILSLAASENLPAGLIKKLRKQSQNQPRANPHVASMLIKNCFATKEDFVLMIPQWIQHADVPRKGFSLIEYGFATKEDFADKIPQWIQAADWPKEAGKLIKLGVARKEDFADKIPQWLKAVHTQERARKLIEYGLASDEDFVRKYYACTVVDEESAERMRQELAGKKWLVTAANSFPAYSFFEHEVFANRIFCHNATCLDGVRPEVGSTWEAEITVNRIKKRKRKQKYGFSIVKARLIGNPAAPGAASGRADGESGCKTADTPKRRTV